MGEKTLQYDTSSILDLSVSLENQDRLYKGLPYHTWKGLLIGTIVSFILNNTAGFLMLAFFTKPLGLIVAVTDVVIFLPLFVVAIIGMRATKESRKSLGTLHVIFWSSVFYLGLLWAFQSWIKGAPKCPQPGEIPSE